MIWDIIRIKVTLILPAFFKRIQGRSVQEVQVKGPVIIAMNHPNAFTDPVAFTYVTYPTRLKYLARGDAFKPGFAAWILEKLGIVPIFRIQDGGKEGLKKNDEAYRRVNYLLKRNHKIIVFAEGLCISERRLRPLKKGVARMVFGAYDFLNNEELRVVPVGVNYSKPDKFRSTLFYNVGEPIFIKDFAEEYKTNPAKAYNRFLQTLEPRMKDLITHIDNRENDQLVEEVEILLRDKIRKEKKLNSRDLYHDYLIAREITETINEYDKTCPDLIRELREKSKEYFRNLKANKVRDWLINPYQNKSVNPAVLVLRCLLIVLGLPVFLTGLIGNYIPYALTAYIVKKRVRVREFRASFSIGIGMFLIWIMYALWFIIVYSLTDSLIWPFLAALVFGLTGWFNLYFYFFVQKTFGIYRILNNIKLRESLAAQRNAVEALLNKIFRYPA